MNIEFLEAAMVWMDVALYVAISGVIGFGLMLSVRRLIESYRIGDWWGILGQSFIILFSLAIALMAVLIIKSKFL